MKLKKSILAVAVMTLPAICFATEANKVDTVKVIEQPRQVIVTQSKDTVLLRVDGSVNDKDYRYEYRVTPKHRGFMTLQREGSDVEFRHPFKRCDTINTRPHVEVFASDFYFGFGRNHLDATSRHAFQKTVSEVGILNVMAVGYMFNKNRSRLSLGVGFNWSFYNLKNPYYWSRNDDGVVGVERNDLEREHHDASLTVMSMQFPLMFNQSLGKRWNIAAGAILNWNYYARFTNSYTLDKSDYSVTTRGLYQRKLSFDCIAMISWRSLGAYFRYAPQSVFKDGFGPDMTKRWSLGLVLRGGL